MRRRIMPEHINYCAYIMRLKLSRSGIQPAEAERCARPGGGGCQAAIGVHTRCAIGGGEYILQAANKQ